MIDRYIQHEPRSKFASQGLAARNGPIKVRKILGLDGREKLQLRIDLGVLQMEMTGPSRWAASAQLRVAPGIISAGRAGGSARRRLRAQPEQCNELQQEGIQYYHRYLSLFQINDFAGVIRDTQRNLDLFTFVDEHTERDELIWSFQQFRPYVLMMNTRAKASILLGDGQFGDAMREIERGATPSGVLPAIEFPELAHEELRDRVPRRMARGSQRKTSALQSSRSCSAKWKSRSRASSTSAPRNCATPSSSSTRR